MTHRKTFGMKLRRVCLILLILSPFLLLGWFHAWGYLKVRMQVRAIRKAGDPATLQDLGDLAQKIPLQEEAAAFYEKVFACLLFDDMDEVQRNQLPSIWRLESGKQAWPLTPEDRQWVRDVLAEDHEALTLLENAPEIQGRVFDRLCVDWPQSFASKRETLSQVVDLLLLQAIYAVDQADTATLVDSIHTVLSVADTLRKEPFGFALGHRQNYISRTVRVLVWASGLVRMSREQQQMLDHLLDGITWPLDLRASLTSERCALRALYQNPTPDILEAFSISDRRGTRPIISARWISAYQWSGLFRHSEAGFLKQSQHIIDTCVTWKPGQTLNVRYDAGLLDRPWKLPLTSMFSSLAESKCERPLRGRAELQVLRGILAARQYRQQTGQWAQTLNVLVPEYLKAIPSDPYTGAPIQVQLRQGGRAIFSVGRDLQVSQEQYFKDDFDRQTSDDIIMWLESPETHPDKVSD